nr:hypothetical protein BaRGS_007335 [Batillaria attramentaria]
MISFTSTLAENVSGKVRKLDLAKSRVVECSQRVEDILDLKFCTDGVQIALQNEDYEKAAGHVHRFRNLDETVIRMSAETNEVPGGTLDTSFKLLYESEEKLKNIVHNKFDAAVHSQDVASVERFFKIFPLLAMHTEGITKFSKYLAAQLSEKADKNLKLALHTSEDDKRAPVLFADTITMLFEGIARVVEIHQPLVETYYGPGRLFGMLQILQKECDRQARKVIEQFKSRRNYDRLGDLEVAVPDENNRKSQVAEIETFWSGCELSRMVQELIGVYIMMEEYFMREMILKDFREVLYARLRAGFPSGFDLQQAYNLVQLSITQGKLQSSDAEKVKARASFLTALNNAEVSCDYCKALKSNLESSLTSANYDTFVSMVTTEITVQLEKGVGKTSFNRVSEIMDYWGQNSGPLTWRLTPTEVRQTLSLRLVVGQVEDLKIYCRYGVLQKNGDLVVDPSGCPETISFVIVSCVQVGSLQRTNTELQSQVLSLTQKVEELEKFRSNATSQLEVLTGGHQDVVWCLTAYRGRLYSAGNDTVIKVWNLDHLAKGCIDNFRGHTDRGAHNDIICAMAIAGEYLFTSSFALIKVWELKTLTLAHSLSGLNHWISLLGLTRQEHLATKTKLGFAG